MSDQLRPIDSGTAASPKWLGLDPGTLCRLP